MIAHEAVGRRYATAVYNLAGAAGCVDRVAADLTAVADGIFGNDDLRRFFLSPVFDRKRKETLLRDAFGRGLHEIVLHTVLLLVRKRREALLPAVAGEYRKLALAGAGKEPLEIVTARTLPQPELDALVGCLGRSYGKDFAVTARTDPALLAGVRITMGDRRVDGSLAARLDDIARELFSHDHPHP